MTSIGGFAATLPEGESERLTNERLTNKLQPLIEIIRIENKLRPSFVQSFALSTFPPRGRLDVRQNFMEARGSRNIRRNFK